MACALFTQVSLVKKKNLPVYYNNMLVSFALHIQDLRKILVNFVKKKKKNLPVFYNNTLINFVLYMQNIPMYYWKTLVSFVKNKK